jgi:hypothetical protein
MAIDGGQSALDGMAVDFNQNLHEHFKVARRANMKTALQTPYIGSSNDPSEREGSKKTITLYHGLKTAEQGGHAQMQLTHNRKTGEVSSTAQSPDYPYGESAEPTSSPKELRENLNKVKKISRNTDWD